MIRAISLWALPLALLAIDPGEVRIRSGPWQPPGTRIAVESRMVEIGVTVRDRKGNLVDGLTAADFEVLDEGKPEPVRFFTERKAAAETGAAAGTSQRENPAATPAPSGGPRTIALYFDDLRADTFGMNRAKTAAEKLVTNSLGPDDRVGIFTSSGFVSEEFTDNHVRLLSALAKLRVHPQSGTQGIGSCPTLTRYQGYAIYTHLDPMAKSVALAEAIACNCMAGDADCPKRQESVVQTAAQSVYSQVETETAEAMDALGAVVRHLAGASGTRILLWMSPGYPATPMETRLDGLVDLAIRARIVINTLDANALGTISPEVLNNRDGLRYDWAQRTVNLRQNTVTALMATISEATGGQLIHNTNDFQTAVRKLAMVESSYVLGIAPSADAGERYHKLQVQIRKEGNFRVDARNGYFASLPEKKPETAQERIDRMVTSRDSLTDFPATVQASAEPAANGQRAVKVMTQVDAKGLVFGDKDGRHLQQLTFVTVLEDSAGNYMMGKEAVMDLEVTDATLEEMRAHGIRTSTSFTAPPVASVVRTLVREASKGAVWASRTVLPAQ